MDYTRAIERLLPTPDGDPIIRHRSGIVDAVNADGSVDVDFGGTVVTGVAVLASAVLSAGSTVQVATWQGDLLVLGDVRASDAGGTLGVLGHAEVTSGQGGIGAETDLTGLSFTATPGLGRLFKLTAEGEFRSTAVDNRLVLSIYEDAAVVGGGVVYNTVASSTLGETLHTEVVIEGDGQEHTYKLTLERTVGAGTAGLLASSTRPAFLLGEDIGGA